MKTIAIIQARMGSERLPGKILKPLGSSHVLEYVVSRSLRIEGVSDVIVATTDLPNDDPVAEWCASHGVAFFRGSQDDVLSRYYECAVRYTPDYILRITADCPFVDYEAAADMIRCIERQPADMLAIQHEGELVRGLIAEAVSMPALAYMHEHGTEPRHREHVTYYAKEFPQLFQLTPYDPPAYMFQSNLRMTIDTEEDYALCRAIVERMGEDKFIPSADMVAFLVKHPEIAELNAHIAQKPVV